MKDIKRLQITEHFNTPAQISDCDNLLQAKLLIDKLISIHGEDAKLSFDSGYNSIYEQVVTTRLESDSEFKLRIEKEIISAEKVIAKNNKKIEQFNNDNKSESADFLIELQKKINLKKLTDNVSNSQNYVKELRKIMP